MVIGLRDKNNNLRIKDILDINIDMSVESVDGVFRVRISKNFMLDENFSSKKAAESAMYNIANIRNELEQEYMG